MFAMLVETPNKEKGRLKPKTLAMERMSIKAKLTRGLIIGTRLVSLKESMVGWTSVVIIYCGEMKMRNSNWLASSSMSYFDKATSLKVS